jgi:hypothetical protein
MARVILIALAVITAVLGYLMENIVLLGLAGAFFVLALLTLAALAVKRRGRRREAERQREIRAASREEELRSLGISDIRPKGGTRPVVATDDGPSAPAAEESEDDVETEVSGGAAVTPEDGPLPEHAHEPSPRSVAPQPEPVNAAPKPVNDPPESVEPEPEPFPMREAREDSPFWRVHSPTAITSYLRALWAATDVQTVALFSSDAEGGAYTLEAALSHNPAIRREGRFSAADHLLETVSADRPLTVLEANDPLVRTLPYYKRAVHVGGVAVLPVRNADGTTVYLVVDLPQDQVGFTERQRNLLGRYADLLGAMLAHPEDAAASQRTTPTRRSIIADEMAQAQEADRPLALALVYRADAEEVADEGTDAVAAAERDLRLHLEDLTPEGRIERFSELVYGAFLYDSPAAIEAWVQRVRTRGAEADMPLVAGVARFADHRDPDALRADAFNALQHALAEREDYVIA